MDQHDRIFLICIAYEGGFGHGFQRDGVCNPYGSGADDFIAWQIGYDAGVDRAIEAAPDIDTIAPPFMRLASE